MYAQRLAGVTPVWPQPPDALTEEDKQTIFSATRYEPFGDRTINELAFTAFYIRAYATTQTIDLSFYEDFYRAFPNTVFIVFPTLPITKVPGDSDLALAIN